MHENRRQKWSRLFRTRKAESQRRLKKQTGRSMILESLESRQLLAADFAAQHNVNEPADVDRDFRITPRDALIVINDLNRNGARPLSNDYDRSDGAWLRDADGDGNLTPRDALTVIHQLNSGEPEGTAVEVTYDLVDADGNSLDPDPTDGVTEFVVGLGDLVTLRYQIQDVQSNPQGAFQVYTDIILNNADDSSVERLELQYGESGIIEISSTTNGGTFTLEFEGEETAPITPALTNNGVLDRAGTVEAIQEALNGLSFVDSPEDVLVESLLVLDSTDSSIRNFGVSFVNSLVRTNVPDVSVGQNNLSQTTGGTPLLQATVLGQGDDPTDRDTFLTATDFATTNPGGFTFANGQEGSLSNPDDGTFVLTDFGGFASAFSATDPGALHTIAEVSFIAATEGEVLLSGGLNNNGGLSEILLFDPPVAVDPGVISFPQNISVRVVNTIVANDDAFPVGGDQILEDTATVNLGVTDNDALIDGNSFSIVEVGTAANATVAISADGQSIDFTPDADRFGDFVFTYTIESDLGDRSTATVTVSVTPVNDAPVVEQTAFAIDEDAAPLTIQGADVFNAGPFETTQTVSIQSVSAIAGATSGRVEVVNGAVVYTPAPDFNGTDIFTVVGVDSEGLESAPTTLTIDIAPVNDAPVAFSGTLSTNEDETLVLSGAAAPTDILAASTPGPANESGQTLTITSATVQGAGSVSISNTGVLEYTPAPNFFGTEVVEYTISDSGTPSLSETGTLTINVVSVNDAPVAGDDTGANNFVVLGLDKVVNDLNVLQNDNAGPGEAAVDNIRIVAVSATALGGIAVISADQQRIEYQPPANVFDTTDTFTYTIEDDFGLQSTATVEVEIVPPQVPFARTDSATVDEDGSIEIDVLENDLVNDGESPLLLGLSNDILASNGTVQIVDNGPGQSDDTILYTPIANFFGTDVFTYILNDTGTGSQQSIGTVTVTVTQQNDAPIALDQSFDNLIEDTPVTITAAELLAGASAGPLEDVIQNLSITAVENVVGGTAEIINGDVLFTPAADFNGAASFTFTVTDDGLSAGAADPMSATAVASLTIAAVNDAPVQFEVFADTIAEDNSLAISTSDLLEDFTPGPATATDEAGQTVSIQPPPGAITSSQGGTVTFSNGTFNYQPAPDFNGTDTFTFTAVDSEGATAIGTAEITVTAVNDAPIAVNIQRDVFSGITSTLDLDVASIAPGPANESAQTVTLIGVQANAQTQGTVVLNADGTVSYTPPADDSITTDSFDYTVQDNGNPALSSTGTVEINILPFQFSSISGLVWIDDDVDGGVDSDELRLGGVEVVLTGRLQGETEDFEPISVLTLADGSYNFGELAPGTFTVSVSGGALLIDGDDFAGEQGDLDTLENQFTVQIDLPGGIDASDYNFSYIGVEASAASRLEQLASGFENQFPGVSLRGFYAAINEDGSPSWSVRRNGFEDTVFGEVVFDDNGNVVLTQIDTNQQVLTATVPRNKAVRVRADNGDALVRIFAEESELRWTAVDLDAPPPASASEHYLSSIEAVFAQEGWGDDDDE